MNIRDNFDTKSFHFVNYVNMTEGQCYAIWESRNHPDVRKWMDNPEPFTWESHLRYVESLKTKDDRSYWAVIHMEELIGSMCLNPISNTPPPYLTDGQKYTINLWGETGMFLRPDYIGKGLGTMMKKEFVDYILSYSDIEALLLKTQHKNIRTIQLNLSLGYQIINRDEAYVYMMKIK